MPSVTMNGKAPNNAKYMTAAAEEGSTQVIIAGNQHHNPARRRSFLPWLKGWSRLELTLACMCIFLAIVVLTLIIILSSSGDSRSNSSTTHPDHPAYGSHKDDNGDYRTHVTIGQSKKGQGQGQPGGGGGSVTDQHNHKDGKSQGVCITPGCAQAASRLLNAMDSSVHPCDNFFDFACGTWNKVNVIPEDRSSYNTFSKLGDRVHAILKNYLEKPVTNQDITAIKKAKWMYSSCMDETRISIEGLQPNKDVLKELGGWPIVEGPNWSAGQDIDVIKTMMDLCLYFSKFLVNIWVSADDKDSSVNIIQLDQPELGMPSRDYFLIQGKGSKIPVYEKYARDVAVMFGADKETAKREAREMVEFEIELAKIVTPRAQRRDNEQMYNKMTVKELIKLVPQFDWLRYLTNIFSAVNIDISEDMHIVVYAPAYFKKFGKLFEKSDKRTMVNYLIWRFVMNRVTNLPPEHRSIKKDYTKSIYGFYRDPPRWYECVALTNDNMGNAVGKLFVMEHFDEGSRSTAMEMIHDIRDSFYELLIEATWMDDKTKVFAKEKAEVMSQKIGYPDSIFNDTALNEEYKDVVVYPDHFFVNVVSYLKQAARSVFKQLKLPVDRDKWSTTPAVVNAFYSSTKNQIMFPAAILQPPFYSKDYPKSLNYGGIGMVIGHEITHGFDDRGRQYDKDGILTQWWDDIVIKRFKKRAKCIIDQYSNYTLPEITQKVNGIHTQGENIADNGGIKEAYRAYKKWVKDHGILEPHLPGLQQFNSDQIFFINFAQVWCGIMRPEEAMNRIKTGVHSPGRFRVIGTLQNMPEFSETFNCPANSYMNRSNRCTVW